MWHYLESSLKNPENSWSLGSFGAIAEFSWREGEALHSPDDDRIGIASERGGIAFHRLDGVQPVAYEMLRKDPQTWSQAVALCLPLVQAARNGRHVITELGPDHEAISTQHRDHILFDLGLGVGFADFCVRSDDAALIEQLRRACGSQLLAPDNPIMSLLIEAAPQRVFETNLARIEVYQPIGIEQSPEGPHTHILPKLIASGRAFSANVPIGDDQLPMLTLHPANPCVDLLGQRKPFLVDEHEQFQSCLKRWAVEEYWKQKSATISALRDGVDCSDFDSGRSRLTRAATRIAIRQHAHLHPSRDLFAWRRAFDIADENHPGDNDEN